jgi:tRNA-2-methylthio-N6-dimethylallyladenosine synthase
MSILADAGYCSTSSEGEADLVLLNTCAIRENAEQRVWGRLGHFKRLKQDRRKQKQWVTGQIVA